MANDLWPETGDPAELPALTGQREGEVDGIRVLTVGFDRLQLIPIIETLCDAEGSAITT